MSASWLRAVPLAAQSILFEVRYPVTWAHAWSGFAAETTKTSGPLVPLAVLPLVVLPLTALAASADRLAGPFVPTLSAARAVPAAPAATPAPPAGAPPATPPGAAG